MDEGDLEFSLECADDRNAELDAEIKRLRTALNLALLRMRGVAMGHRTHGRPELGEVAQRWAEDIETALKQ